MRKLASVDPLDIGTLAELGGRFHRTLVETSGLPRLIDQLQSWHEAKRFQDAERAARLHLHAAIVAARMEQLAAARRLVANGLTYQTRNASLSAALRQLQAQLD